MYDHRAQSRLTRWVDHLCVAAILTGMVAVIVLVAYSVVDALAGGS